MHFRYLCCFCSLLAYVLASGEAMAQRYAGFIDEAKFSTSDSLMNVGGLEYYLLYENYENVHFLSLVSQTREWTFGSGEVEAAFGQFQEQRHAGDQQISQTLRQVRVGVTLQFQVMRHQQFRIQDHR